MFLQNGHYFIDRDGRHFHDILNYLRVCAGFACRHTVSSPHLVTLVHSDLKHTIVQDGSFSYPPDGADFKYLLELRAEAEYYGLTGLLESIDRYPVSARQVRGAHLLDLTFWPSP